MEVLYARESASANEVMDALPNSPGNATVRKLLRILEEKGQIEHFDVGNTFRYRTKVNRKSAATGALQKLAETFFGGSMQELVATLIDPKDKHLSDKELWELEQLIQKSRESNSAS